MHDNIRVFDLRFFFIRNLFNFCFQLFHREKNDSTTNIETTTFKKNRKIEKFRKYCTNFKSHNLNCIVFFVVVVVVVAALSQNLMMMLCCFIKQNHNLRQSFQISCRSNQNCVYDFNLIRRHNRIDEFLSCHFWNHYIFFLNSLSSKMFLNEFCDNTSFLTRFIVFFFYWNV